jgi:hypothetical protein
MPTDALASFVVRTITLALTGIIVSTHDCLGTNGQALCPMLHDRDI